MQNGRVRQDSRTWWGKLGTPDFLTEVGSYLEQARQATEEGTIYRKRVELIDAGILQHMLTARARYEKSAISEFAPVSTAAVARVRSEVSLDDWADDATWADALVNEIQKTLTSEPVPQKTVFTLAYDAKNLYIYARCLEPNLSQIKAATHNNDVGGFSDDSIELFVDPSGKGETYYQFCINSRGTVYDALENPTAIGATATITWDSDIKVKTAIGRDAWELRAALPFANLVKEPPKSGSTWRFNLCRNRFSEPGKPPYSAWSLTPAGFKDPPRFGIITFNTREDRGRTVWNCDFESVAFALESGEIPLIGRDGWYENTAYADRGWDRSWKVSDGGGNRRAVCDINATCPSDVVPMHAVQVSPGVASVEVDFRRLATDNQPALTIAAADGKRIGYMYAWAGRSDLVAIEQPGNRQNYGHAQHGLGEFSEPGKWFGLKLVIDTARKTITGYIRSDRGEWVKLNKAPLAYYDPAADGTLLFLGFGTYKQKTVDNNVLEMDNIRVIQLSHEE